MSNNENAVGLNNVAAVLHEAASYFSKASEL
jgi:hypothetical protein